MDVLLALLAGTVLVLGLASRLLKDHSLSPVLLALVGGAAVGRPGWGDSTRPAELSTTASIAGALVIAVALAALHLAAPHIRKLAGVP